MSGAPWEGRHVCQREQGSERVPSVRRNCADKARLQSDPQLRQCFLEVQRRWLSLARIYEFAERLEFLSVAEEGNKNARLIIKDAD
jgi:hypothetical protein